MDYQNITHKANRTIVVGDIHGCSGELQELLRVSNFSSTDLLIAVGDLVDRGPASWEVARFFRDTPNAYSVLGNHERRVAGVISGKSQPAWTQRHTLNQIDPANQQKWAKYFLSLPAVIETDHAIITHARLDSDKCLEDQDPYHTSGVGGEGAKIVLDDKGIPLWFRAWNEKHGSEKPICIGHLEYGRVELVPKKLYALDTDAVKGGQLTALVLPEGRLVEINCEHNHYEQSHREWMRIQWGNVNALDFSFTVMLKVQEKNQLANPYEQDAMTRFQASLTKLNITPRFSELKHGMLERFGSIPQAVLPTAHIEPFCERLNRAT